MRQRFKSKAKVWFTIYKKSSTEGSIEDVYYVPDLKSNILSMGQLMEKGYSVFMKNQVLQLKDNRGQLVARVEMAKNRMYKLNLRSVRENVCKSM